MYVIVRYHAVQESRAMNVETVNWNVISNATSERHKRAPTQLFCLWNCKQTFFSTLLFQIFVPNFFIHFDFNLLLFFNNLLFWWKNYDFFNFAALIDVNGNNWMNKLFYLWKYIFLKTFFLPRIVLPNLVSKNAENLVD